MLLAMHDNQHLMEENVASVETLEISEKGAEEACASERQAHKQIMSRTIENLTQTSRPWPEDHLLHTHGHW